MKTKINYLYLLAFFALFIFSACQDEETEVNSPTDQEIIAPNSPLASFISNVSANFGAYDDILDDASCFSIELPVTIIVSDITITIETEADLQQLEDLFEEFEDEDDFLDFVFPLTIIFNDYTEIVIENEDQLENLISECDEVDEVIECIDFVYPISFSVFNSDFNIVDTVTIENDEALYNFLDDIEDDEDAVIVSLNYPVTLQYSNGETIEVNSNQELADAIESAEDDCDYDNEENDCNEDDVAELLVDCPWDINDEFNDFENYQIVFHDSGDLQILEGETTSAIGGLWNLSSTDEGLILTLSELTAFQDDLGGEWLIVECNDNELEIIRGDYSIELEQDCDGDENPFECFGNYDISVCDQADDIEDGFGVFDLNLIFDNCPNDDIEYAFYYLLSDAENQTNPLPQSTYVNTTNPQTIYSRVALAGDSSIFEIFTHTLIVEDCSEENCSEEDVDAFLTSCIWNAVNYNGSDNLMDWNFDFESNSQIVVIYTDSQTIDATWITSQSSDGIIVIFSNVAGPNIQAITGEWLVVECEEDRLELHRESDILVLERNCD